MGKERAEFVAGKKKKPTPLFHTQLAYFPSRSGGEFRLFAILPRKSRREEENRIFFFLLSMHIAKATQNICKN